MTTAADLRKKLLSVAEVVIEEKLANAKGVDGPIGYSNHPFMRRSQDEIWKAILPIIHATEDAIDGNLNLSDGTISDKVDAVMAAIARGDLSIDQGKRLIEMLQAGFEIQEIREIIDKINYIKDNSEF